MSFVQAILDFLRQFWPLQVVYSYQRGVRFWCGHDTAELLPGLYWFVPFFGHIELVNIKPDIINLTSQNLTTGDGVGVSLSANMTFEVFDARAAHVNVQNVFNNLADECRTALATRIRDYHFEDLLAEQADLEECCMQDINAAARGWGVRVTRIGLADFIRTKSISLSNKT